MVTAMKNNNVFINSILLEENKMPQQTVTERLVKKQFCGIQLWKGTPTPGLAPLLPFSLVVNTLETLQF